MNTVEYFDESGKKFTKQQRKKTEDIRAFKKSLEDGFDIGDIGGVVENRFFWNWQWA